MTYTLNGFDTKAVTLKHDETFDVGAAVMLTDAYTVSMPASGNPFCGVCTEVRGDYATVVLGGYVKVKYTGTAPTVGYQKLSADGKGNVKADTTNGREHLVLSVDSNNSTVEFIL